MTSRGAYKGGLSAKVAPESFGARLRRIRVAWGLTQGQFGERLNTDQQMISLWERGKTQPSRTGATLLASYLGLSVEALMTGEGFTVPDMPTPTDSDSIACYLPNLSPGVMVAVDLGTGQATPMDLGELKDLLDHHRKRGSRAWVVVEELEPRKG